MVAKLNKQLKQFRLEVSTVALLEALAEKMKSNQTEVVEYALISLASKEFSIDQRNKIVIDRVSEILKEKR
jgi:hypothetical protein